MLMYDEINTLNHKMSDGWLTEVIYIRGLNVHLNMFKQIEIKRIE